MSAPVTRIRGADWVVGFDAQAAGHCYLRHADVAFAGGRIIHVGGRYDGPVAVELPGADRLVLPGLVNIHGHLGTELLGRGFFEDIGNRNHHMSRLYEYIYTVRPPDARTRRAATRLSIAELLQSGATTVADMSVPYEGWEACCAGTGARVYLVPMFKSANWSVPDGNRIEYVWDVAAGAAGLAEALGVIGAAREHASGRLHGMVMPAQVDTCTPELLQAAAAAAKAHGLPLQIHCGQSVPEFHEMVRRHGTTGIGFLERLGVLGPNTTLAHCIFTDGHPWLHWHEGRDLERLAGSGTSVVHCPRVFAYRGMMMHDFGSYRRAGINMAVGTDTAPHDMVGEMQLALFTAKLSRGDVDRTRTADMFHAATLGGARALGREDLGRLEAGAQADLVVVDLAHMAMQPLYDPLRCFIFSGGRAVLDVFVAGHCVVGDGQVKTMDVAEAIADLRVGHAAAMRNVPQRDWAGRDAATISPLSLPMR